MNEKYDVNSDRYQAKAQTQPNTYLLRLKEKKIRDSR